MDADLLIPHGPAWSGATVLVVDDEVLVRRVLRRRLEIEGFHVEEAEDGESALRLIQARTEPLNLVLTDLSMPSIDGRQVSETLAQYRPDVAVLCMSAGPDSVPYIESSHTRPGDAQTLQRRRPVPCGAGRHHPGHRLSGDR